MYEEPFNPEALLSGVIRAPLGTTRHPLSNPDKTTINENKQCQSCFKNKTMAGKGMRRCSGCNIAYYCSEACQRKEWKKHKPQCQQMQASREAMPEYQRAINQLRDFTTQHRPTISEAAEMIGFNYPPDYFLSHVLLILCSPRTRPYRPETSFYVSSMSMVRVQDMPEGAEAIQAEINRMKTQFPDLGCLLFVSLLCIEKSVHNMMKTAVDFEAENRREWNNDRCREIVERMNAGITL